VLSSQILLFMISQFSVSIKCRLGSSVVTSVSDAKKVLVVAAKAAGKDRIVDLTKCEELQSVVVAGSKFSISTFKFEFQKVFYNYSSDTDSFTRLKYPSNGMADKFYNSMGHKCPQDVSAAARQWGRNDFDIPLPDFLDLYVVSMIINPHKIYINSYCAI
jgi:manganese-transporting P-type ATPase